MLNTKTLLELEIAQNATITKFNLKKSFCNDGINNGDLNLEDGLPWLEIEGKFSKAISKQFVQELADAMNIRVLYNRMSSFGNGDSVLYIVLDIDTSKDYKNKSDLVPAYSYDNPEEAEFMEDYGKEFFPTNFKKAKITKQTLMK
jgi:hypothetical protein